VIFAEVGQNRIKPGEELTCTVIFIYRLIDPNKSFLREIEGIIGIAHQSQCDKVGVLFVFINQSLKSSHFALLAKKDQLFVVVFQRWLLFNLIYTQPLDLFKQILVRDKTNVLTLI